MTAKTVDDFLQSGNLDTLKTFFPENRFSTLIKKVSHCAKTGTWIDEHALGRTLNTQSYDQYTENEIEETLGYERCQRARQMSVELSTSEKVSYYASFFWQFVKSPIATGAILPSSSFSAKHIVKNIRTSDEYGEPHNYLEVGPGPGPFTREIIRNMGPNDHLDLVEYSEEFCEILNRRFGHLPNVTIHNESFLDYNTDTDYDAIISALPLSIFSIEQVQGIYNRFASLLQAKRGTLSYIEYMGIHHVQKYVLSKSRIEEYHQIQEIKDLFFENNNGDFDISYCNLPPARICHCTIHE